MTPLLQQFLSEARDFLQGISEKLIQLETAPDDAVLMGELFRLVHTLKGNCGLFDFPEMLRVLHAAEDLMVVVRDGDLAYDQNLADCLLDAMDFIGVLLDEIECDGTSNARHATTSANLAHSLRSLIPVDVAGVSNLSTLVSANHTQVVHSVSDVVLLLPISDVPEEMRMALYRRFVSEQSGNPGAPPCCPLFWIIYTPEPECFFKGEDPFFLVRQVPALEWRRIDALQPWPTLAELDAYQSNLKIQMISCALRAQIDEHFRYVPEQVSVFEILPMMLVLPVGDMNGGPVYEDFIVAALAHLDKSDLCSLTRAASSMLELSSPGLWLSSALRWLLLVIETEPKNFSCMRNLLESLRSFTAPDQSNVSPRGVSEVLPAQLPALVDASAMPKAALSESKDLRQGTTDSVVALVSDTRKSIAESIIQAQLMVLGLPDQVQWLAGRLASVSTTLKRCFTSLEKTDLLVGIDTALALALSQSSAAPLRDWLIAHQSVETISINDDMAKSAGAVVQELTDTSGETILAPMSAPAAIANDGEIKFGRRSEDVSGSVKTLKVDQEKIDRLMNLIGEMVVAKNGLPYLASRAETVFGVRDLSREIKAQYAVINRIAEEMQGAIMQVRMLPVSFVFQRFPRLVRDISRKLGKEINLVLEGENTEADKNIIEALADPLIHIVRNSLDHGFETPEVRRSLGKPAEGRLLIRASQEAGRVIIDISDDGKGIDPAIIKTKAFEKGIIDELTFDRMSDMEAINLVFAAGFSTAEVVSDLSGRGVGMDVVRVAVEQVNGTVTLDSKVGEGTRLRLSLPLSIAVTNVMIVESNRQIFGVPMDMVVETVRVPRTSMHAIKNHQTAVLRGRVVPLRSLNELLATDQPQCANEEDELATLVIRMRGEHVGILVDDFKGVVDIILKPMGGILGSLSAYSGSALLGDGSVLMVLNLKEMI